MTKIRDNVLLCMMIVCFIAAFSFCFMPDVFDDGNVAYAASITMDLRDGSEVQIASSTYNFEPTWKEYQFVGWSTKIDDERYLVDKTSGDNESEYDLADFEEGATYYAVWSTINDVIVTTEQLNFNDGNTRVKFLQKRHGIFWTSHNLVLENARFDVKVLDSANTYQMALIIPDGATVTIKGENNVSIYGEVEETGVYTDVDTLGCPIVCAIGNVASDNDMTITGDGVLNLSSEGVITDGRMYSANIFSAGYLTIGGTGTITGIAGKPVASSASYSDVSIANILCTSTMNIGMDANDDVNFNLIAITDFDSTCNTYYRNIVSVGTANFYNCALYADVQSVELDETPDISKAINIQAYGDSNLRIYAGYYSLTSTIQHKDSIIGGINVVCKASNIKLGQDDLGPTVRNGQSAENAGEIQATAIDVSSPFILTFGPYVDLRDGNVPFVPDSTFDFNNPTWKDYQFFGWATEIDNVETIISKGIDDSYGLEDFNRDQVYYAVWKVASHGGIVTTVPIDFTNQFQRNKYVAEHNGITWSNNEIIFNNATIDVPYGIGIRFSERTDLVLIGENVIITGPNGSDVSYTAAIDGSNVNSDITIKGDGSLKTVTADSDTGNSFGIYSRNITIESGDISLQVGRGVKSYGMHADVTVKISGENTKVCAISGESAGLSVGIYANYGDVSITNGAQVDVVYMDNQGPTLASGIYSVIGNVSILSGAKVTVGVVEDDETYNVATESYGIKAKEKIRIAGTETEVNVTAGMAGQAVGVYSEGDIVIASGTFNVSAHASDAGSTGIACNGTLEIIGGETVVTTDLAQSSGNSVGTHSNEFTLTSGHLTIETGECPENSIGIWTESTDSVHPGISVIGGKIFVTTGEGTVSSAGIVASNMIKILSGYVSIFTCETSTQHHAIYSIGGALQIGTIDNVAQISNHNEDEYTYIELESKVLEQMYPTEPLIISFRQSMSLGEFALQSYSYYSKEVGTSISFINFDIEPTTVSVELYKNGALYTILEGKIIIGKLVIYICRVDVGDYGVKVIAYDGDDVCEAEDNLIIVKSEDNEITDIKVSNWKENSQPVLPTANAKYGEVVFEYSDSATGDFSEEIPMTAGIWFARAKVIETVNFNGVVSDPVKFTITREKLVSADGNVIVETEKGFDPDIEIVAEFIEKDHITTTNGLIANYSRDIKLGKEEYLGFVYVVKLTRLDSLGNVVEVQPDDLGEGTILTIKMRVPDYLTDVEFIKLVHVHSTKDIDYIDFNAEGLDEDGFYSFEVDRLSEFSFICKNVGGCMIHWYLIALFAAYALFFIIWYFILRRHRFDAVALPVTVCSAIVVAFITMVRGNDFYCDLFAGLNIGLLVVATILFLLGKKLFKEKYGQIEYLSAELDEEPEETVEETVEELLVAEEEPEEEKAYLPAELDEEPEEETVEEPQVEEIVAVEEPMEEKSLSESLAIVADIKKTAFGKKEIADYLEDKYGDKVKCNRRPNQTPISARNGKSLPLADTHYVNLENGKSVCFVYVYEYDEGGVLLLLRTREDHAKRLKNDHALVAASKYPKSGTAKWYSVPVDDSFTEQQVYDALDEAMNICIDPNFGLVAEPMEEKSLSESLAIVAEIKNATFGKKEIADYLENKYGDEVKLNRRPNQTPISARNGKSLPLADTHYVNLESGKSTCFVYVYEYDEGGVLLLLKTREEHAKLLKKDHALVSVSKYPKSGTATWYSVPVDDSFTEQQVYDALDEAIKCCKDPNYIPSGVVEEPEEEVVEEKSLSESLAIAADIKNDKFGKKEVADYLENTYGDEVKLNRRPNQTPISARNGKSLPLADTHYVNTEKKSVCFVYVYETEQGGMLMLLKTSSKHAKLLKKDHKLVAVSKYPKSSTPWYSVAIDDSFTEQQVYTMLDDVIKFTKDPNYVPGIVELESTSLSESLKAAEQATKGVSLGKGAIADYLENNYADRVKCNRRPNQTPISARNGKSLPLADTHYVKTKEKDVCFVYVYETEQGGLLTLLKTSEQHAKLLKEEHELVSVSKYPKSSTPWYSVAIDDSFTDEQVYKMLDDTIKVIDDPDYFKPDDGLEEKSLSESLESSKTDHEGVSVGKSAIADYLESKYDDEVTLNRRPNQTPVNARNGKSLPLADTHYVNTAKKPVCFVYVYETDEGGILLLLKTNEKHAKALKKKHPLVAVSKYPKSSNPWYSVAIDGTFTDEQIFKMLDDTIALYKDSDDNAVEKAEVKDEPVVEVVEEQVVEEQIVESEEEVKEEPVEEVVEEKNEDVVNEVASDVETVEEPAVEEPTEIVEEVAAEIAQDETTEEEPEVEIVEEEPAVEEVVEEPEIEIVEEVSVYDVNKMISDDAVEKFEQLSVRKSDKSVKAIVNIDTISNHFKANERVTLDELKKRLPNFNKKVTYVKVLGRGKIDKPLIVDLDEYSLEAAKMIILTGGKVIKPEK